MKRYLILILTLITALILPCITSATEASEYAVYTAYEVTSAPTIDGEKDTLYGNTPSLTLDSFIGLNGVSVTTDTKADVYIAYTASGMYFLVDVTDDTKQATFISNTDLSVLKAPYNFSPAPYNDCVLVGINASGEACYDTSNQAGILGSYRPVGEESAYYSALSVGGIGEAKAVCAKDKADGSGYIAELFIPFTDNITLENLKNGKIDFQIEVVNANGAVAGASDTAAEKAKIICAYSNPDITKDWRFVLSDTFNGALWAWNRNNILPAGADGYDKLSAKTASANVYNVTVDVKGTTTTETTGTNGTYTLPAEPKMEDGVSFLGWEYGETFLPAGASVTLTSNTTIKAVCLKASTLDGASVRISSPTGLRFTVNIDANSYDALSTAVQGKIGFGMVLFPQDLLKENVLTKSSYVIKNSKTYNALIIANTHVMSSLKTEENGVGVYSVKCVWSNIYSSNYTRNVVARGYIDVTYTNGTSNTVYLGTVTRNVKAVAQAAIDSGNYAAGSDAREVLDSFVTDYGKATAIHVNQIGYIPSQVKRAIVVGGGKEFYLIDADTNETKYTGLIEKGSDGVDKYSGDTVYYADFSEFTVPGNYYLYVPLGNVSSYEFAIGNDALDEISKATLKAFYYQRCGETLTEEYAGDMARNACHTYASDYIPINGESKLVLGGWHDAGDCGDYTMVTCLVLELMFLQYDMMPDMYGDANGIPESENGVPDILDEAKVGIDWLFQMQDTDGGVYHSRGNNYSVALGPLEEDTAMYYLWPKTVEATCMFVSAMNSAYKEFKSIDAEYAERCKTAALNSMNWLTENWDDETKTSNTLVYGSKWSQNSEGYGTFAYLDNNDRSEEHMAAALAYYELTGDETWHQKFIDAYNAKKTDFSVTKQVVYNDNAFVTCYKYVKSDVVKDDATVESIKTRMQTRKNSIIAEFNSMAYRLANSGDKFGWGSNHELTSQLIMLMLVDDVMGTDGAYDDIIVESVDYILGKNAVGYCFITGYGSNPVLHMHHRATYETDKILPGYMVSGPVVFWTAVISHKNLGDYGLSNDTPVLKCFYDDWSLYRFTESDVSRLVTSSFVIAYVRSLA